MIQIAYDLPYFQVEGSDWIRNSDARETQYDVAVLMDKGTTREQFRLMMQNLLAERLHLQFHRVTKVLPAPTNWWSRMVDSSSRRAMEEALRCQTKRATATLKLAPTNPRQRESAMQLPEINSDQGFMFPSLSTALQEQLGLRLVKGTAPFAMFVVDSADKVPTEN